MKKKLEMCPSEHEWPASHKSVKPPKQTKIKLFRQFPNQNIIILVYNTSSIIIELVCASLDSNPRPYDYESDALSLSYRPI